MRILYISQYFPPEMGAPSARVSELARHWVGAGHKVQVLTGFPNHPTGKVPEDYRARFRRFVCREEVGGVEVVRTWLLPFPNRKSLERLLNYLSFCISSSLTGSFLRSPEVIIATSPQLFVGLAGWWLSRLKRVPWILEIRDFWPESITASGMSSPDSIPIRAIARLAKFLYRAADHIVVVTPAFKEYLLKRYIIHENKISIVENGVETKLFTPDGPGDDFNNGPLSKDKFIVAYIGTVGLAHGLDSVLQAADLLKTAHPHILFLIVGSGADKGRLKSLVKEMALPNVVFLPEYPREKVPALIRACQACLVLLKKADVFKTVIPTKMLEFMACGRPVILGVDGQARQIMEEARAGLYTTPEEPGALAESIIILSQDEKLRNQMGKNGRHFIVNQMCRKEKADLYLNIIEAICRKKKLP